MPSGGKLPVSEVDLVILGIFALSALISFMRGFFREAMSLAIWGGAVVITLAYTDRFATLLPIERVDSEQARATISAVVLFAGTLLAGNLINWVFGRIMARKTLSIADRVIGVFFGMVRGLIIVALLVLAGNVFVLNNDLTAPAIPRVVAANPSRDAAKNGRIQSRAYVGR